MKIAWRLAISTVVLMLAFSVGFSWRDIRLGSAPSLEAFSKLLSGRIDDGETPTQVFKSNYGSILSDFHRPIDPRKLRYSAMEGLFASLGDPHTQFLEPQAAADLAIDTRGNYAGIGARLGPHLLGAQVGTVFKNGPAAKAGLMNGDIVTAVDGMAISGMAVTEIVQYVRGEQGTSVTLTIIREDEEQKIQITIGRAIVTVPTAEGKMIENTNIGYIAVTQFSETTVAQFDTALLDIHRLRPDGLVIDLRNNPGGLLETTEAMLSRFIDGKTVVTMKKKRGRRETSESQKGKTLGITYPVIVLINRDSASASEIFAGVMRDYKKATLLGETTYGKASVQNVILLKDMSRAKITIARYYLPSGENISRKVDEDGTRISGGITPQYEVPLDTSVQWELGDPEKDNQLAEAIHLIENKLGS